MVPTLAQMRAECVRHYESKGYSPEWAERVVYANRKLIPSVYAIIQAEQQGSEIPYPPIETEADEETAANEQRFSFYPRVKVRGSQNFWPKPVKCSPRTFI